MTRRIATLASAAIVVFSVTFVAARWTAPEAPAPSRLDLVATPVVPPPAPLTVRTLGVAAKLPDLRAPTDPKPPAALAEAPSPSPSPSMASPSSAEPRWRRDFGRHARAAWPALPPG